MVVSIDIGTSYSSICMLGPEGKAQPVDISTGASMFGSKYSLPTAVFVEDNGRILVGQAAMNSRKRRPQNFRMEFKRNLGEDVPILLGERSFRPEELYTEVFMHMKACAEKVSGEPAEKIYLTCPASYGERRKEKLRSAAKAAGLFDVELVDEPTAAAMCYCAQGYLQDGQTLLVYDFGGGTFDVSLLRYQNGAFELLAEPEGLEQCGGIDMDRLIYQDMLASVEPEVLEELRGNELHYMRFTSQLAELAVKAKHHLTAAEVFEEDIQIGFDMVPYRLTVEKFNGMVAPLVGQTIQMCRQAMEAAGVDAPELSAVLMVGGTSRVPLVQEMAGKISASAKTLCAMDLELVVAQGALAYRMFGAGKEKAGDVQESPLAIARECYRKGLREINGKKEIEYYLQAAKMEYGPAAYRLYAMSKKYAEWEDKVIPWCLRDAERKDPEAAWVLGYCYKAGKCGASQDERKAEQWYRKEFLWNQELAGQGDLDSIRSLGDAYEGGRGVSKDSSQAVEWYRKGVELGDGFCAEYLGDMYKEGEGVRKDSSQAVEWYRKGVELGKGSCAWCLGNMYEEGEGVPKDSSRAAEWYRKGVELGKGSCAWCLGNMYKKGEGVPKDSSQAVEWYRKGVELGDRNCAEYLGDMYRWGEGVPRDSSQAVEWYRKGVELGEGFCAWYLGNMYKEGKGVPEDSSQAVEWYRKGVELGERFCAEYLGDMYKEGEGVPKDSSQAVEWYRKGVELGDRNCAEHLGEMYRRGEGVPKDSSQAVECYRKGVELRNGDCAYLLGNMYLEGEGVPKDSSQAVECYRKGVELGNGSCALRLAWCYRDGTGVRQSDDQAFQWMRRSVELGNGLAAESLGFAYEMGLGDHFCYGRGKNYKKAIKWYLKGAEIEDESSSLCMYRLGEVYKEVGNMIKAVEWYKKAAEQGDSSAAEKLQELGVN